MSVVGCQSSDFERKADTSNRRFEPRVAGPPRAVAPFALDVLAYSGGFRGSLVHTTIAPQIPFPALSSSAGTSDVPT